MKLSKTFSYFLFFLSLTISSFGQSSSISWSLFSGGYGVAGSPNSSLISVTGLVTSNPISNDNSVVQSGFLVYSSPFITNLPDNKEALPGKYELMQNYPNPFNPSTKIKFSISKAGMVTLKVFNILGKEIITLINEEKGVGIYETEFNARELSSGIYFYKIISGDFISSKKMILLK